MSKLTRTVALVATALALAAGCKTNNHPPAPTGHAVASMKRKGPPAHPIGPRTAATPPRRTLGVAAAGLPQLRGVNLTGGEMDYGSSNVTSPVSGTDYLFVSHQDIDYLASRGVSFARLIFSWEGMEPNGINTPLATSGNNGIYVSTLVDRVSYANSKGMYVMIEPHGASDKNFARYKGNLVGTSAVPNSAFAYFWTQLANQFKGNALVGFGLSNEPNNQSTVQWFQAAQAAILGIRSTGATNTVFVPGNGWTGADSWTSNWYDTASPQVSNATAWAQYINDPGNNVVVSVHSYLDSGGGGGANDIVSPTIEVDRVSVTVAWARSVGVRVHVGEFGTTASSAAQVAVSNWLAYEAANTDVLVGYSWWAFGPPAWWAGYQFTLDPTSNYTVDQPQMGWLKPYFVPIAPPPPPPVDAGPPSPQDAGIVDAGSDAGHDAGSSDAGPAPKVKPMVVTATKTQDWGTGYCKQFFFKNPNSTPLAWKKMTIYLKDGTLRGPTSVWGAIFPNTSATGTVVVTPDPQANPVDDPIPADGQSHQAVGFCADYGSSKYVGTNGGLN